MYDLVIRGGRVVDPSQNMDDIQDVAVTGDKIAAIEKEISPEKSKQVVDAGGKLVTPGLIDLHCHAAGSLRTVLMDGVLTPHINPDDAGVNQSVTTVVEAGSMGQALFKYNYV